MLKDARCLCSLGRRKGEEPREINSHSPAMSFSVSSSGPSSWAHSSLNILALWRAKEISGVWLEHWLYSVNTTQFKIFILFYFLCVVYNVCVHVCGWMLLWRSKVDDQREQFLLHNLEPCVLSQSVVCTLQAFARNAHICTTLCYFLQWF